MNPSNVGQWECVPTPCWPSTTEGTSWRCICGGLAWIPHTFVNLSAAFQTASSHRLPQFDTSSSAKESCFLSPLPLSNWLKSGELSVNVWRETEFVTLPPGWSCQCQEQSHSLQEASCPMGGVAQVDMWDYAEISQLSPTCLVWSAPQTFPSPHNLVPGQQDTEASLSISKASKPGLGSQGTLSWGLAGRVSACTRHLLTVSQKVLPLPLCTQAQSQPLHAQLHTPGVLLLYSSHITECPTAPLKFSESFWCLLLGRRNDVNPSPAQSQHLVSCLKCQVLQRLFKSQKLPCATFNGKWNNRWYRNYNA